MRQPKRREHDEQVHLGNAEFQVLPLRRIIPVERRWDFLLPEQVMVFALANKPRRLTQAPRLVDTVTSGDAVTIRAANSLSPRAVH